MEAVIFDGTALTLRHVSNYPIPKIVNDTDVIVKVQYSGVCGTDLLVIQGKFPARKDTGPMGHEFCGVISDVGSKSIFKIGQLVAVDPNNPCNLCKSCRSGKYQYCTIGGNNNTLGIHRDGGWAEYCRAPQEQVYALPEGITAREGGISEPFSCVAHGYDLASPLVVGSKILVVGAGIMGNLWIVALHHHGHRDVTVSEMNKSRLESVKKLETGYRLVTPDVLAQESILYDVIIDVTGVGKVMEISFKYLAYGGKYVLFGCAQSTDKAIINPYDIYCKEIKVVGVKINPFTFVNAISWIKAMGPRYVDYNKLGVKTYSLKEYESLFTDLKAGSVSKAMFKI